MDAVDPETGAKLDIDSLIAECTVQIVAGVDTTAYTLNWTFDLLFQHPRVFRKLEAEILAHFPQKNSDSRIWYKDAKELPYLDAVILESMRFRTVAEMILPRTAPDGGRTIGGYYIPGGTSIGGTTRTIHRNPEVFDRPDEFIPERFLDGSEEQLALRRQSVVPFSIGVRACLGRQLALMELYTCIAALIREFEISPAQQPYIPRTEENFFLLAPKERSLPALVKARAS
ncbi:cytochrome P450 [Ramicandelaber brevisporus]|nr:cytochrome P450 [Ramicandelaber brevisporus]